MVKNEFFGGVLTSTGENVLEFKDKLIRDKEFRNNYFKTTNLITAFEDISLFIENEKVKQNLSGMVHAAVVIRAAIGREEMVNEAIIAERKYSEYLRLLNESVEPSEEIYDMVIDFIGYASDVARGIVEVVPRSSKNGTHKR